MNREDVISMALEAGFTWEPINNIVGPLERFAALVAAAERSACAQVAEDPTHGLSAWRCRENIAAAIRARSDQ